MGKVLIIHHVEPVWESGLRQLFGVNLEDYMRRIAKFIRANNFDLVIGTFFEDAKPSLEHDYTGLVNLINKWIGYGYGWPAVAIAENPDLFIEGGRHSEAVMVPDWMKRLQGEQVAICGCFDGQCIEDLEIALDHLDIEFNRIENLIY